MNGRLLPHKADRWLAALCHVLAIVGPLWLPFLASVVMRPISVYACRHALRAAFDNFWGEAITLVLMVASFGWTIIQFIQSLQGGFHFDLKMTLIHIGVVVGLYLLFEAWNFVVSVKWIIKALKGEDPPMHPWVERLAPRRDALPVAP